MIEVERFLSQGGSVCPFARQSQRIYATIGPSPRADRQAILEAAARFAAAQEPDCALLVVGGRSSGFQATKSWAQAVFLELMACFGQLAGADAVAVRALIDRQIRPILLDDTDRRRPTLACHDAPLFAICMAPVYPRTHPRYAPQPVVVVTRQADIGRVQAGPATARIREIMAREHGFVYDADELMLPLPGEPLKEKVAPAVVEE